MTTEKEFDRRLRHGNVLFWQSASLILLWLLTAATASVASPPPSTASIASVSSAEMTTVSEKQLTLQSMSQSIRKMQYAVRGQVVIAADKINDELQQAKSTSKKYPFDHIVYTNIGNPQSVGQLPLTWPRQVMALVDLPDEVGIDHPEASSLFPADAIARARHIKHVALHGHGSGSYSHSKGVKDFRQDVADFITNRDRYETDKVPMKAADPEDIFLTNGASAGIEMILDALIADETCGTMVRTIDTIVDLCIRLDQRTEKDGRRTSSSNQIVVRTYYVTLSIQSL